MTQSQLSILISAKDMASNVMTQVGGAIDDVKNRSVGLAKNGLNLVNSGFQKTAEIAKYAIVGLGGLAIAFASLGFQRSVEIQSAMADVQKSAGITTEEVSSLRNEILQLGITTGTQSLDLIGIAKIGGQIGVAKEELLNFTSAIDTAAVRKKTHEWTGQNFTDIYVANVNKDTTLS